jgi:hypothetical protein
MLTICCIVFYTRRISTRSRGGDGGTGGSSGSEWRSRGFEILDQPRSPGDHHVGGRRQLFWAGEAVDVRYAGGGFRAAVAAGQVSDAGGAGGWDRGIGTGVGGRAGGALLEAYQNWRS